MLLEATGKAKEGHQLLVSGVDAVEAGRAGGIASGIARRLSRSVRSVAESGYLQAIKAMSEVVTWWASKREEELEQKGYSLQRTVSILTRPGGRVQRFASGASNSLAFSDLLGEPARPRRPGTHKCSLRPVAKRGATCVSLQWRTSRHFGACLEFARVPIMPRAAS